jgi:hypothetical protein
MSPTSNRRKCRCCREFFFPDYRNRDHQHYCDKPACRHASKQASQRRWLAKPANRDHFRGQAHVERVRKWRQAHPGYWKPKTSASESAQAAPAQALNPEQSTCNVPPSPLGTLQDSWSAKDPAFIGLLSMITGRTLQEDIVPTADRVIEQGRIILGLRAPGFTQPKTESCL